MPGAGRSTATFLVRFQAACTIIWIVLMAPSLLWWKDSIPWLVAMSVWANVAGHFAGWMGARGERATEQGQQDGNTGAG